MKRTKTPLALVCLLLALCLFSGCGLIVYTEEHAEKTTAPSNQGPMTTAPTYTADTIPPAAQLTDPKLKEQAKERLDKVFYMDMTGSTVLVAVADETANTFSQGENAPLYSAYKERNKMLADKLGCEFIVVNTSVEQMAADLSASIKSGSNTSYYSDLLLIPSTHAAFFAASGLILDLRSLPFYTATTDGNKGAGYYNGKSFFDIGSVTESPELVYALYFNRDMTEADGAEELYAAARDGSLTFDYFLAFSERISVSGGSHSLSVGGAHDDASFLGDIAAIRGGVDFVSGKSGGYPQISHSSSALDAVDALVALLRETSLYLPSAPEGEGAPAAKTGAEIFAEGKSLFHMGTLSEMSSFYNKKTAWGVLPLPTLGGEPYAVASQDRGVLCVSANNQRPDAMGVLLPALDAASGEWIDGEYAAYCAENYIRDNDSFHMIKKILSEEIYADFSYLHYENCKNLDAAAFGAFRTAVLNGSTPSENINAVLKDVNKALKKIKY
jgi:hypothetical protein